jgi:DNA-binding NarL/FixJ family response regulator
MTPITVVLVDDQPAIRHGLRLRIAAESDIVVVGEAGDGAAALDLVTALAPDVVIMDVSMPGIDGIDATSRLRAMAPGSTIVILSLHDDAVTRARAATAGAAAFVSKHEADALLLDTIRRLGQPHP